MHRRCLVWCGRIWCWFNCRNDHGDSIGEAKVPRFGDRLTFPVPPLRATRYKTIPRNEPLLMGIQPEHITEARPHAEAGVEPFDAVLDVTEPMGMETLVYFTLEGAQVCERVNPNVAAHVGAPMDLNNMHLLDRASGAVLGRP